MNRAAARFAVKAVISLTMLLSVLVAPAPQALAQSLYFEKPLPIYIRRPTILLSTGFGNRETAVLDSRGEKQAEQSTRSTSFRVRTSGFVYHPALVSWSVDLHPAFGNTKYSSSDISESARRNEHNYLGYTLSTQWLSYKPYSFNLASSRVRREISVDLQSPTTSEYSTDSFSMSLDELFVPIRVSYRTHENTSEGYYSQVSSGDSLTISGNKTTDQSRTLINLQRSRKERDALRYNQRAENITGSLANNFEFNEKMRLTSNLNFRDYTSGVFNGRSGSVRSFAAVKHPWRLRSNWHAMWMRNESGNRSVDSSSASASLSHQLYENLTSAASIGWSNTQSGDAGLDRLMSRLSTKYNRRVPWGSIAASYGRAVTDTGSRTLSAEVDAVNESYIFDEGTISVTIDNRSVDPNSILVTDVSGQVIYEPGLDYDISVEGESVVITRNALGDIADGSTILVSYRYILDYRTIGKTVSTSRGFGTSFGKHVTIRYSEGQTDLDGPVEPDISLPRFDLRERNQKTLTATLRFGDSPRFRCNTMLQVRKDDFVEEQGLNQVIESQLSRATQFRLSAGVNEREFLDTGKQSSNYSLSMQLSGRIKYKDTYSIKAALQRSEGEFLDQNSWQVSANYSWSFGAWSPRLSYSVGKSFNDFVGFEYSRQSIYFSVTRFIR